MFLAQATFGKLPANMDADEVADKLDGYFGMLQKNGQICGDTLHTVSSGNVVAFASLVRPDAMLRTHHSRYAIVELDVLCELFGKPPNWEILTDHVPTEFPDLFNSSALCLFSSLVDGLSPICCMDTDERLPLYMIPIDDDVRERLYFWSREYNRMDGIWMSSGELEIPAYEQIATACSMLAKEGRKLAAQVESALNIPVYYFITRYYGRGKNDSKRCCPECGKDWRYEIATSKSHFLNLPFRCSECRLVSQSANADYDDSHAQIGEFPASPPGGATGQCDDRGTFDS